MQKEEFSFSPLQPILFVIGVPAIMYFFSDHINWFSITHSWLTLLIIPLLLFTWRQLRITILMLMNRPAVVLTDDAITITERGYTIKWRDIKDVSIASDGSPSGGITAPKNRYVILRVREPEKYIKSIKNPFTRYYRWYTRTLWSLSPFEVSLFLVRGDDDEIYHTILRYYQNNRGF